MSLLCFFKCWIPTPEGAGIGSKVTEAAYKVVEKIQIVTRKRKQYSTYSKGSNAKIGKCDAKNGNSAALKRFRATMRSLEKNCNLSKRIP